MLKRILSGELRVLRLIIIAAVVGLVLVGLACITAATGAGSYFARQQCFWLALGAIAFVLVNLIHYRTIGRASTALFTLSLLLLLALLAGKYLHLRSLVPSIRGASRWIHLGPLPSIQPSELAKFAYILALAAYLRHRQTYRTLAGLVPPFLLTFLPMALILLQPDLGTVLLFPPVLFAVLFVAGARLRHLLLIALAALVLLPAAYFIPGLMKPYQKDRLEVLVKQGATDTYWLNGPGYQLHQSKMCIGSGRLSGTDEDIAPYLIRYLPDNHNDFIFSLIGHRWGFVGAICVLALYTSLIIAATAVAAHQNDPFAKLLAVGIAALLATQVIINVAMTVGLMPITGMTLPFVSYGGSSLITNFLALGLLFNLARHRTRQIAPRPFQFDN